MRLPTTVRPSRRSVVRRTSPPANDAGTAATTSSSGVGSSPYSGAAPRPPADLLIRAGHLLDPRAGLDGAYDLLVRDGRIAEIAEAGSLTPPEGTMLFDGEHHHVFPGFIDPHVHIYLPFMATFAKDTHETASIAALVGGTTTYIEMCCPSRLDNALEGYYLWKSKAEGSSACDYTFHMAVSKYTTETEAQLRDIVRDGINSFKIFLAYKDFFGIDDCEMYRTLTLARKLGVIVTAHCENAELVAQLRGAQAPVVDFDALFIPDRMPSSKFHPESAIRSGKSCGLRMSSELRPGCILLASSRTFFSWRVINSIISPSTAVMVSRVKAAMTES